MSPGAIDLTDLLRKGRTRAEALTFLLVTLICQRLDMTGDAETSFLPPEVLATIQSMSESSTAKCKQPEVDFNMNSHSDKDLVASIRIWRLQTMPLLADRYASKHISRSDPRSSHIIALLDQLMPILQPFVRDGQGTRAFEELEDLLDEAARFGLQLLSSKAEWEFCFEAGERAWRERQDVPGWPGLKRADVEWNFSRGGFSSPTHFNSELFTGHLSRNFSS